MKLNKILYFLYLLLVLSFITLIYQLVVNKNIYQQLIGTQNELRNAKQEIEILKSKKFIRKSVILNLSFQKASSDVGIHFTQDKDLLYDEENYSFQGDLYTVNTFDLNNGAIIGNFQKLATYSASVDNQQSFLDIRKQSINITNSTATNNLQILPASVIWMDLSKQEGIYKPYNDGRSHIEIFTNKNGIKMRLYFMTSGSSGMRMHIDFITQNYYYVDLSTYIETRDYYKSGFKENYDVEDWIRDNKVAEIESFKQFADSIED